MMNLLELHDITKIYEGGILANHNVNFSIKKGEIHALVGENGAGKSTLMKIIFGMENITSGHMFMDGKEVKFASSKDAIHAGIGMVHQHFMLVESMTGEDNLMLGLKKRGFLINRKEEDKAFTELLEKYNFSISRRKSVMDMSVGMKQKLEIIKILYRGARLLILDEPTAVLTPQETEELFERLISLKKNGMTIIFISHKLGEVKRISDRITVLKNGETKGTFSASDITEEELSDKMVGRVISFEYDKKKMNSDVELLKVDNIKFKDHFGVARLNGVSFHVRNREIVGIAGVEGNGQKELIEIITSNNSPLSGNVVFKGHDIAKMPVNQVRSLGMSYVPEDRMYNGCAASMTIQENLIVSNVDSFASRMKLLNQRKITQHCKRLIHEFHVKTRDEIQPIKSLSGGNIQKIIVAREFCADSDLLVLDQPTRGIDIGAVSFIHKKILEMREAGKGVLLVSADLNELIALSDRILVIYKGRIVAFLDNQKKVNEQELGLYMLGIKRQEDVV
ncbi:MAG: ABC transporter ATP-binding protein [Hungatella sp.]|jgi:simple sugar transport system ATP-binding protein|nr:ABC transporter ATP-binding protein [Hungatella sp.]